MNNIRTYNRVDVTDRSIFECAWLISNGYRFKSEGDHVYLVCELKPRRLPEPHRAGRPRMHSGAIAERLLGPYRVPAPEGVLLPRVRGSIGRCYEFAGRFALVNPRLNLEVVHATVNHSIPHAWVEFDELVYDGALAGVFRREGYYSVMTPDDLTLYPPEEYRDRVSWHGSWGPFEAW